MAAGVSQVEAYEFHLAGGEHNRRASHVAVTSCELYAGPGGPPIAGGIYDQRMGTTDHGLLCTTCLEGKRRCFGHAGSLELRLPVTQPVGVAEIRRWLRVACHGCGAALVDVDRFRGAPAAARLALAAQVATEGKACAACGAVQPRVVKDEEDSFSFRLEPAGPRPPPGAPAPPPGARLFPAEIGRILGRVPDALIEALGRAPRTVRALVLDCIVVSPNTVRPGVKNFGGGGGSYHDQTNMLQHVVKRNSLLPEEAPAELGDETKRVALLLEQLYNDMILGSASTSAMQGSSGRRGIVAGSRQIVSILRNLARKPGRIRMNLLGKRVFCISRSTISGNSSFLPHQVGVPLAFARILPVEETVQAYNLARLTAAFLNGRRQYPGCTQVRRRATGEIHDVAGLRGVRLEIGDVVWRDVVDGDLAFFNRQPTLERSSIGVHSIVVLRDPGDRTLQMNVVSCSQYNADFSVGV